MAFPNLSVRYEFGLILGTVLVWLRTGALEVAKALDKKAVSWPLAC